MIVYLATSLPTTAACVTAETLKSGVEFTRADGTEGLALQVGAKVRINYRRSAPEGRQDVREGPFGIYEFQTILAGTRPNGTAIDEGVRNETVMSLARPAMEPVSNEMLKTGWRERTNACNASGCKEIWRSWGAVTYKFLPSQTVSISGCDYKAIPVEGTFRGTVPLFTQRWLYFPNLGFGLETRFTDFVHGEDRKMGLTAMEPAN